MSDTPPVASASPAEDGQEEVQAPTPAEVRAEFVGWGQYHFADVEFFTTEQKLRWCPTWWEHPEAVHRLKALWMAYKETVYSTHWDALSSWWVHHWEPHRAVLFSQNGPFWYCDLEHGHLWAKHDNSLQPVLTLPPEDWEVPEDWSPPGAKPAAAQSDA